MKKITKEQYDTMKGCIAGASSNNTEINHPSYYNKGSRECIDIMRDLFGDEAVRGFCRCNSFKYRFRAGDKPGNDAEKDLKKAEWYEDYLHKMNIAEHDKLIFLEREENGKNIRIVKSVFITGYV